MLASVTVLLALATSAFSYMVTSPSNSSGWTTSGPNVVTWTKVDTDRANFTIVLNNQQVTPQYTQILDAFVVGTDGSVTVNPPSGGWVAGSNYRVNLVQDSNDLSALLAQSGFFTIAQASSASSTFSSSSTGSSSAASSSGSVSATSTGSSVTSPASSGTDTSSSGSLNPTSSDTSTSPTGTNAATAGMGMQAGLVVLLGFLGVTLF